ncbi:MAG: ribonuclease E activity regulator RraA [Gemmatimonadota bacterium]
MTSHGWTTADLCDAHPDRVRVAEAIFRDYGGSREFTGEISTVRVREDYRPILQALSEPGRNRVLVVDGGGSVSRAILGEKLLGTAQRNGWAGVVVNGAVRDTALTTLIPIGLRALGTIPQRGESGAHSARDEPVVFAGITFTPGGRLWADVDGIIVADGEL